MSDGTKYIPKVGDVIRILPNPKTRETAFNLIAKIAAVDEDGDLVHCDVIEDPHGWGRDVINIRGQGLSEHLGTLYEVLPPVPTLTSVEEAQRWLAQRSK